MTYEPVLNDKQAAEFLGGICIQTLHRLANSGKLPFFRVGKFYRYRASQLETWLNEHAGQLKKGANNERECLPRKTQRR